jgi:hypothetical protein
VLLRKGSNLVHNQFLKLGFTHYFLEVGRILAYKIYKIYEFTYRLRNPNP